MIRTDEQTSRALNDWVETGYFKSRSEADNLFLREPLKIRTEELDKLKEHLQEVKAAKEKLRDKADEIFALKKLEAQGRSSLARRTSREKIGKRKTARKHGLP